MNKEKRKRVSVYLKAGELAATPYYRFYQFFGQIDADFRYNLMISDRRWGSFFPIAKQPSWKKVLIFFYIYFRVLYHLIIDTARCPDFVIISRCLINRVFPYSYRLLLKVIKHRKGCVVFDFDDEILSAGEISRNGFDFLSGLSDVIVVGSPLLKEVVKEGEREKVHFLPTTDGDFRGLVTEEATALRIRSFDKEVRIVWVGTFSSLMFLREVNESFERFGEYLASNGKNLILSVVCDYPFDVCPSNYQLNNVKWSRQTAINEMLCAHVGIMPLKDSKSARGKCSFKLIQYLSAGLPIVGTSIGMNEMVLRDSVGVGLKSNDVDLWWDALLSVTSSKEHWQNLSKNALFFWESEFNYSNNLKWWKCLLEGPLALDA